MAKYAVKTLFRRHHMGIDVMSAERRTLAAQIDPDSELADQFDDYREQISAQSNSEAVRQLVRVGLEQEHEPARGDSEGLENERTDKDQQPASDQQINLDLIKGNEPILAGIAFILGSESFLSAITAVTGGYIGTLIFTAVGLLIVVSLIPIFLNRTWEISGDIVGETAE